MFIRMHDTMTVWQMGCLINDYIRVTGNEGYKVVTMHGGTAYLDTDADVPQRVLDKYETFIKVV